MPCEAEAWMQLAEAACDTWLLLCNIEAECSGVSIFQADCDCTNYAYSTYIYIYL